MVWEFAELVGRRLIVWALASVVAGTALLLLGDAFWRGVGAQALVWGAIDGAIGLGGLRGAARDRRKGRGDPAAPAAAARKLRRLLYLNGGLDVLYVAGGLALAGPFSGGDPFTIGSGWGIVVQGGFLLVFDLVHARLVPAATPFLPGDLALFAGPEHRPFELGPGGGVGAADDVGGPTALLVHGFAGTPAEMRPLGEALAGAGWRVRAPLLPGMGEGIGELTERTHGDWLDAVHEAAEPLRGAGAPFLLVGYSLGGALSLVAAERLRPDGLVLLAPFWWPRPRWWPAAGLVRAFLPTGARPFARLDLAAPDVRQGIAAFLPGLDLDDPAVEAALREARIPVGTFTELFRLSIRAHDAVRRLDLPVLVVQGTRDEVVRPERTRTLAAAFRRAAGLVELDAGHDLVGARAADPAAVHGPVLEFAASLRDGTAPARTAA